MAHATTMVMEPVASWDAPEGTDARLVLADGTECSLRRLDPRFAVWLRLLAHARKTGQLVYLECGPDGQALAILPVAARRVEAVLPVDGMRARVQIEMSPSFDYHLDTRHPQHAELRARLLQAAASKEPVFLATDPRSAEVLAARLVPKNASVVVI